MLDQLGKAFRIYEFIRSRGVYITYSVLLGYSGGDPFTISIVFTPDTDVFLFLNHFHLSLTEALVFRTERGN